MTEIYGLLHNTKLQELRKIQNLVLLRDTSTVEDALQVLAKHKILSAPVVVDSECDLHNNISNVTEDGPQNKHQKIDVVESQQQVVSSNNTSGMQFPQNSRTKDVIGFVDIKDIIGSFLADLDQKEAMELSMFKRINYLDDKGLEFCSKLLKNLKVVGTDGTFIHSALSSVSLMDLIYQGFLSPQKQYRYIEDGIIKFPSVVHRAAIFDNNEKITNVISQTDIIRYILEHKEALGEMGHTQMINLEIGSSPVVVAYPTMLTFEVLKIMSEKFIHAVAVVNKEGQVIGNFSYSIMRNFYSEHFGTLGLPVGEFLALQHGSEYLGYSIQHNQSPQQENVRDMSLQQQQQEKQQQEVQSELLQQQKQQSPQQQQQQYQCVNGHTLSQHQDNIKQLQEHNNKIGNSINLCQTTDTLIQVIQKLVVNRIHRVYVIDKNMCPIKVVTLTDVLKKVVGYH